MLEGPYTSRWRKNWNAFPLDELRNFVRSSSCAARHAVFCCWQNAEDFFVPKRSYFVVVAKRVIFQNQRSEFMRLALYYCFWHHNNRSKSIASCRFRFWVMENLSFPYAIDEVILIGTSFRSWCAIPETLIKNTFFDVTNSRANKPPFSLRYCFFLRRSISIVQVPWFHLMQGGFMFTLVNFTLSGTGKVWRLFTFETHFLYKKIWIPLHRN